MNSEECKISIIVPVYNKEKYLNSCVDSLLNQTYSDYEIILVDDGSTDGSGKICDSYAECQDRVTVIHQKNGGPSSAWKTGFAASSGQYIMFIDSDDYIDNNMLEEMSAELTGISKEMILSDYAITKDDGKERDVYQRLEPGVYDREKIESEIRPQLLGNEHRLVSFSRCMKLIGRQLIADNMDFCDNRVLMGDDATIILPALIDSERIVMMQKKTYYHYRYIEDSIVHRYDEKAYENNKLFYEALLRMLNAKFASNSHELSAMRSALNREEMYMLLLVVKNEVRGNKKGAYDNLHRLRYDSFADAIINDTSISVSDKANKLVLAVLKKPTRLRIGLLRVAFAIYDR